MKDIEAAGEDLSSIRNRDRGLADAIDRYTRESVKEMGRSKAQVLRSIPEYDIANMACSDIKSHDIVAFAKKIGTTRTPSTVSNYLSHLGAVFALARTSWGMELNEQTMKACRGCSRQDFRFRRLPPCPGTALGLPFSDTPISNRKAANMKAGIGWTRLSATASRETGIGLFVAINLSTLLVSKEVQ